MVTSYFDLIFFKFESDRTSLVVNVKLFLMLDVDRKIAPYNSINNNIGCQHERKFVHFTVETVSS
jgi:hypothetical protein